MSERDDLLAALRSRVEQVIVTEDLAPVHGPAPLAEGRRLYEIAGDDLEVLHAIGWVHWLRYQGQPDPEGQSDLRISVRALTHCFVRGVPDLPDALLPELAQSAAPMAVGWLEQLLHDGTDRELCFATARAWQRIVDCTPHGHQDGPRYLSNLGLAMVCWFELTTERSDADLAIDATRASLAVAPAGFPDADRATTLTNLCLGLRLRAEHFASRADLDEAVGAGQAAMAITAEDHPARSRHLQSLARAHHDRYKAAGAQTDLDQAVDAYRASASDPGISPVARAVTLGLLGPALQRRFELTGELADLDEAIEAHRTALDTGPVRQIIRPRLIGGLGLALITRFERTQNPADLDEAIEAFRVSASTSAPGDPVKVDSLSNLSVAIHARFERTGNLADLDPMIEACREAAAIVPEGNPLRPQMLCNLGGALIRRFELAGNPADLTDAIEICPKAVAAADNGTAVQSRLNLAIALKNRAGHGGTLADLDAAIDAERAAVALADAGHPSRATGLSNLALSLKTRCNRTDALADLRAAIDLGHEAIGSARPDDPDRPHMMANLADAYAMRYLRLGDPADLDASVATAQRAVTTARPADPSRGIYLATLAAALMSRFRQAGALADVDRAIESARDAVSRTPADAPSRPSQLSVLVNALRIRHIWTGQADDLAEAIKAGQAAVSGAAADNPHRALALGQLSMALIQRFTDYGRPEDLDGAIEAGQGAVAAALPRDADRGVYLAVLADAPRVRGQRGALADIDAAIEAAKAAADAAPGNHGNRTAFLMSVFTATRDRFRRTGSAADLNQAIEAGQIAFDAAPDDHLFQAACASMLGNMLQSRFLLTGQEADLNSAIGATQAAVNATAAGHPFREQTLALAASARFVQFSRTRARDDVDAVVEFLQAALDIARADHPYLASRQVFLGSALAARHQLTGLPEDLEASLAILAKAAATEIAPPSYRIAAEALGAVLTGESDPARAANMLERAILLLPITASIRLARDDQQHALGNLAGLASEAAALALGDPTPGTTAGQKAVRALRLLESGRAVLLSQALSTRDDLADLEQRDPGLARRFTELRDYLDQSQDDAASPVSLELGSARLAPGDLRPATPDRHKLADELTRLLEQIRQLDGFDSFGLPPSTGELLAQASGGPIVTFSTSSRRCDALLLTEDGIAVAELPGLTLDGLISQVRSFQEALQAAGAQTATPAGQVAAQQAISQTLGWLWDAVAGPVLLALGYDRPPPAGQWPRVWWAPGGLLGLLPLHAAGYHGDLSPGGDGRPAVMDRVVSSYTPTIRALRRARQRAQAAGPATDRQSLIVAMPATPGLPGSALPGVLAEVELVRDLLPRPVVLRPAPGPGPGLAVAPERLATKANVLTQLGDSVIAHFACHGLSDLVNPSKSSLLLQDFQADPLTVASLAPVNLAQAQLAYLSACQTATVPASGLIDEAIQLATAFQLAGFPSVVGTLWPVHDRIAAAVAGKFYQQLRTGQGTIATASAALALHHAVRHLRDRYPQAPFLWAAYLHAGA